MAEQGSAAGQAGQASGRAKGQSRPNHGHEHPHPHPNGTANGRRPPSLNPRDMLEGDGLDEARAILSGQHPALLLLPNALPPVDDPDLQDPAAFFQAASDTQGHHVTIQLHLPPQVAGELAAVLNGRLWPYREKEQIIRHGIMVLLRKLHKARPPEQTLLAQMDILNGIMAQEYYRQKTEEVLQKAGQHVSWFVQEGSISEAKRFIAQVVRELEDGGAQSGIDMFYRRWLKDRIRAMFGPYCPDGY